MCGIMGIACYGSKLSIHQLNNTEKMISDLLKESQRRGSDAAGLCCLTRTGDAILLKDHEPSRKFVYRDDFRRIFNSDINYRTNLRSIIAHTRAQTKGTYLDNKNNHPIVAEDVIGVHNGAISNDDTLFDAYSNCIKRAGKVDSEIIFRLINYYSSFYDLVGSVQKTAAEITGSYSCAFLHLNRPNYLTLFTGNVSSIYLMDFRVHSMMVFASTRQILEEAMKDNVVFSNPTVGMNFRANAGVRINLTNGSIYEFRTNEEPKEPEEDEVEKVGKVFSSMTGSPTPLLPRMGHQ